jgi:hypothetical protein
MITEKKKETDNNWKALLKEVLQLTKEVEKNVRLDHPAKDKKQFHFYQ